MIRDFSSSDYLFNYLMITFSTFFALRLDKNAVLRILHSHPVQIKIFNRRVGVFVGNYIFNSVK